jgi:hypothetical protein
MLKKEIVVICRNLSGRSKENRFNAVQSGRQLLRFRRNLKPETSLSKKIHLFYLEARGRLLHRSVGIPLYQTTLQHIPGDGLCSDEYLLASHSQVMWDL